MRGDQKRPEAMKLGQKTKEKRPTMKKGTQNLAHTCRRLLNTSRRTSSPKHKTSHGVTNRAPKQQQPKAPPLPKSSGAKGTQGAGGCRGHNTRPSRPTLYRTPSHSAVETNARTAPLYYYTRVARTHRLLLLSGCATPDTVRRPRR